MSQDHSGLPTLLQTGLLVGTVIGAGIGLSALRMHLNPSSADSMDNFDRKSNVCYRRCGITVRNAQLGSACYKRCMKFVSFAAIAVAEAQAREKTAARL